MKKDKAYKNLLKLIFKLENISIKNKQKVDNRADERFFKDIIFDLHNIRIKIERNINR
ncbi:hypothetical protein [Aliarcobacter thereius]|uniref:Uncharacterized protein n=1 Tax=Aliarcobacter thereius LMG 24486 TaxID=1032240 RepID=A0A1C7WP05_9BACT|nr:hypothetical protein [Aliarcobacter thereius]OCL95496.1 hypothetical protein AA347_00955 [Aliarcobacter thereius LMG 24486]QBF16517.1 hypothetical protein ATH_1491 [Aliarcobacter thereius LMG 24486]